MTTSMFTAIGALGLHQTFMDVVADNLANANTPGFKASRVLFQDQFSQVLSPGSAPSTGNGGLNPVQVGLGAQMGYATPIFTQGMLQETGRNLDLAIQGDGFFIYTDSAGGYRYSRDGSLQVDSQGYLVNGATGARVQGWQLETGQAGPVDPLQPITSLRLPLDLTLARATTKVSFGGNLYPQSTDSGGGATTYTTTAGVFDSLGARHDLQIKFTSAGDLAWDWEVTGPEGASGNGTLTFDENGQIADDSTGGTVTIPGANGAADMEVTLDFSGATMLAGPNSLTLSSQDGLAAGQVSDVYVAPNTGEIYLLFTNGLKQLLGQTAIARFANPSGLLRDGHSMFRVGLNSGDPSVGLPNTGGRGSVAPEHIEGSNVDMAKEFTNMILAERGFQASARVITTSDEMTLELVNLKR